MMGFARSLRKTWVLLPTCALALGCGSGAGDVDDDAEIGVDAGGMDAIVQQPDTGPQDSTVGPQEDATLDVNLPDSYWTADSGKGVVDSGTDTGLPCSPDGILCNVNTAEICKAGVLSTQLCTGGDICAPGYGCVVCIPGSGTCSGSTGTLCNSMGTGYITNNCDSELGLTCQAGVCTGDCANIGESYIGCEYWSVTMLNHLLDQGAFPFAVSVSNTTSKSATVNITGPHAVTGNPFTVAANTIQSIVLPWEASLSCGAGPCVNGTTQPTAPTTELVTGGAYHIKSTEPVTVYQFNARDYEIASKCSTTDEFYSTSPPCYSYTNDASLLIPVNALTGNYYVATYNSFYNWPGLIDIVGTQASTSVTVSPSVAIVAGGGLTTTGGTITLNAGDVIQITNPTPGTVSYGTDMSGTLVKATAPVEVFGGQACIYIPATEAACDHMEEVMFPLETLGSTYLVVPPNMTGITTTKSPSHFVRIIGTVASTTLTYTPSPTISSGTLPTTLNAGQVGIFETPTPFQVTASSPVLVSMYMEGSENYGGGVLNGDPSQSIAVATAQFRDNYTFTAPNNYYINWVTVIAPSGNSVTIDTTTIPSTSFTAIGTSGYGYYHYQICDDGGSPLCSAVSSNHAASSAGTFGIQVYGYGSYTSYWYPGGLNLTR